MTSIDDIVSGMTWQGQIETLTEAANERLEALGLTTDGPLTVRLVRDYVRRGIVQKPRRVGKTAIYGERQLSELMAARVLLADGWPLGKIADYLRRCDDQALHRLIPAAPAVDPASKAPEGQAALQLIHRFQAGAGQEPAPEPAARAASPEIAAAAASLTEHRTALQGALQTLAVQPDAIQAESVTRLRLTPWCEVIIDQAQLTRLSPAEAQALGQALTACLLRPDGFQLDPSAGETA